MSFLLKETIHRSLAETLYNEIISRRSIYYYFIGNILEWDDELVPDTPLDTIEYENYTRNGIISIKKINLRDISLVIPRRDWASNVVYDQYDDYSSYVVSNSNATNLRDANFYVLSSNYNVYKCLYNNEGSNSTVEPTETDFTPISTGDGYIWKYMYTIPLANRNKFLTSDYMPVQRAINTSYYSNGEINSVVVIDRGSGYTGNSSVTLTVLGDFLGGNGNVVANLTPQFNDSGEFIDVLINNPGNNYKYAFITINDSEGTGRSLYKRVSNIKLLSTGSGYTQPIASNTRAVITTTGSKQPTANAQANLIFFNNVVVGLNLINPGYGYDANVSANTSIAISTTGTGQPSSNANAILYFHTQAVLTPLLINGRFEDIIIEDPGTNYSSNTNTQVSIIGDGIGAVLTPYINDAGEIEDVIIESRGVGYTFADIRIVGDGQGANVATNFLLTSELDTLQTIVEVTAVEGAIHAVRINDSGDGFSHANIVIEGDGTNFSGNVVITNNSIVKVNISDTGANYSFANVKIIGDGANANLTAILTPVGGHGKDAVSELFCDSVMLTSTINSDLNHGKYVNNDFRQFGIIKDVKGFKSGLTFDNVNGSACFLVSANTTGLSRDSILRINVGNVNRYFEVVEVPSSSQLLLLSKNNYELQPGDELVNNSTLVSYVIGNVDKKPDINKSSGQLLFIDNRTAVSQSAQQLVTLRTVIRL